ncbi:hypothetical protein ADUPG1_008964 [Aduncisulcus paluster]|uniref:Uncharacterized protein n=1 Tax=Aduncisulcus paluster TaxID=2918883 RepID=A0ABQ5KTW8_9EUKA|nr:hypothetical protein ADUPG1_008964 [Aduncisulcus paluster]
MQFGVALLEWDGCSFQKTLSSDKKGAFLLKKPKWFMGVAADEEDAHIIPMKTGPDVRFNFSKSKAKIRFENHQRKLSHMQKFASKLSSEAKTRCGPCQCFHHKLRGGINTL